MKKRFLALLLAVAMVMTLAPAAFAEDDSGQTVGDDGNTLTITQIGGSGGYSVKNKTITINASGTYHIVGNGTVVGGNIGFGNSTEDRDITIILENVKIDNSSNQSTDLAAMAYRYNTGNNKGALRLTIQLKGDNLLQAGGDRAGLVWGGPEDMPSTLTIEAATGEEETATLKAYGGRQNNVKNQGGAGIGGDWTTQNSSNITIKSGTVYAYGGGRCSGIGGGSNGDQYPGYGANITIEGGTVYAYGGGYGAGIGGGAGQAGTDITINGGEVSSTGKDNAPGIGGGFDINGEDDMSNVVINGGQVGAVTDNGDGNIIDGSVTNPSTGEGGGSSTPVYSVVIPNSSDLKWIAVLGGSTYSRQNTGSDFQLYLPGGQNYTLVTAQDTKYTATWDESSKSFTVTLVNSGEEGGGEEGGSGEVTPPGGDVVIPPVITNPSYAISVPAAANGTVTVNPASAQQGAAVTITATPNEGYELASLTVTDGRGNAVAVYTNPNGTYSFTMPSSQVTVITVFQAVMEEPEVWVNPFVDVASSDWFYAYVEYACQNGLMNGTSAVTFHPTGTTTRGMLMTILARLDGTDTSASTPWYQDGMIWAVAQGVSDGTNPEGLITREQVAAMLYRYAGSPAVTGDFLSGFADAASVSDWAVSAMNWAVSMGIVTGGDAGLNPGGTATRAELAAMLMRFCENVR